MSASSSVRAASCSPSVSGPLFHRRGSDSRRSCCFEQFFHPLWSLVPFAAISPVSIALGSSFLLLVFGTLALSVAAVPPVSVAVGSNTLLLAFGLWLLSSPRFVLSPSLSLRAASAVFPAIWRRTCQRRIGFCHHMFRLRAWLTRQLDPRSLLDPSGPLCPAPTPL